MELLQEILKADEENIDTIICMSLRILLKNIILAQKEL